MSKLLTDYQHRRWKQEKADDKADKEELIPNWADFYEQRRNKARGKQKPNTDLSKREARRITAKISSIHVTLPEQVTYDELWEFLDEHYPLKFLLEEAPGGALLYSEEGGFDQLNTLLSSFWQIAGPKRALSLVG